MNQTVVSTTRLLLNEGFIPSSSVHLANNIEDTANSSTSNIEDVFIALGLIGVILGCAALRSVGQFLHNQIVKYQSKNVSRHFTWDDWSIKHHGAPVTLEELKRLQEIVAQYEMRRVAHLEENSWISLSPRNSDAITYPMYFSPRNKQIANAPNNECEDEDLNISMRSVYS